MPACFCWGKLPRLLPATNRNIQHSRSLDLRTGRASSLSGHLTLERGWTWERARGCVAVPPFCGCWGPCSAWVHPFLANTFKQSPFSRRPIPPLGCLFESSQLLAKKGFGADGLLHKIRGSWFSKSQNIRGGRNFSGHLVQPLHLTSLEAKAQSS